MDERSACRDNVFVERLSRSVKYERVYLKAYDGVSAARADIADDLDWYDAHRSHSSLERLTPNDAVRLSRRLRRQRAPSKVQQGPMVYCATQPVILNMKALT
jgi:transposase InsO family protein